MYAEPSISKTIKPLSSIKTPQTQSQIAQIDLSLISQALFHFPENFFVLSLLSLFHFWHFYFAFQAQRGKGNGGQKQIMRGKKKKRAKFKIDILKCFLSALPCSSTIFLTQNISKLIQAFQIRQTTGKSSKAILRFKPPFKSFYKRHNIRFFQYQFKHLAARGLQHYIVMFLSYLVFKAFA